MNLQDLKVNVIVRGPMFPEPVKIIRVVPMGGSIKLVGQGMNTGLVHQPILSPAQLASLEGSPEQQPFDGDATKFKLGVEAIRLYQRCSAHINPRSSPSSSTITDSRSCPQCAG